MSAGLKGGAAAPSSEQALSRSPLRFVSAASLFDGHDAAINMIRRLLQARGAEVVHLGHNRSVADIVRAAIDEDADRSEEHTSELQSRFDLVCRLLLEKKKNDLDHYLRHAKQEDNHERRGRCCQRAHSYYT